MKQFDPRSTRKIKQAVRRALSGGASSTTVGGFGKATILEGLLKDDLNAPVSFGESTTVDLQIWIPTEDENGDMTLIKSNPEQTVTIYSFSTGLDVSKGTYVMVEAVGGKWRIVWVDCDDDAHPELV